jgi:hypothetical protein
LCGRWAAERREIAGNINEIVKRKLAESALPEAEIKAHPDESLLAAGRNAIRQLPWSFPVSAPSTSCCPSLLSASSGSR